MNERPEVAPTPVIVDLVEDSTISLRYSQITQTTSIFFEELFEELKVGNKFNSTKAPNILLTQLVIIDPGRVFNFSVGYVNHELRKNLDIRIQKTNPARYGLNGNPRRVKEQFALTNSDDWQADEIRIPWNDAFEYMQDKKIADENNNFWLVFKS